MLLPEEYIPANTGGSRAIVVLAWLFPALATLFVVARFASRRLGKIHYGSDDWIILASLVPVWGQTAIILITVYYGGMGHEYVTVPPDNRVVLTKCLTILPMFFGSSLGLAKTSIVLLLIRIFDTPRFRKIAYLLIFYIVCWSVMSILVAALTCRPLARSWDSTVEGTCANLLGSHTAISSLDILGDVLIIILPMPKVWKLQQDFATKLLLTFIFGLGAFDIVCGVLLVYSLTQTFGSNNLTIVGVDAWIWTILEPSVAVMIACAPSLRPLYNFMRWGNGTGPKSFDERGGSIGDYDQNNLVENPRLRRDLMAKNADGLEVDVGYKAAIRAGRSREDGDLIPLSERPSTLDRSSIGENFTSDESEGNAGIKIHHEFHVGYDKI